jgi:hypothetical protein
MLLQTLPCIDTAGSYCYPHVWIGYTTMLVAPHNPAAVGKNGAEKAPETTEQAWWMDGGRELFYCYAAAAAND